MVELELLERREGTVALLDQLQAAALARAELVEPVARGRRVAQERARHEHDGHEREHRSEHEREGHAGAVAYRSARRRCSTASGQSATREPKTKRRPAAQIRLTSGFTSTLRSIV